MATASRCGVHLEERRTPALTEASPYTVHSLMMIFTSAQGGQLRTDRRVADAEDALIASLWKLANQLPYHLDSEITPDSEENDDINQVAPLAAAVAYDAAALKTVLESAFPDQVSLIKTTYSKLMLDLLLGLKEPYSCGLLLLSRECVMGQARVAMGGLKVFRVYADPDGSLDAFRSTEETK